MKVTYKKVSYLGLTAALVGTTALVGCAEESGEASENAEGTEVAGAMSHEAGEGGEVASVGEGEGEVEGEGEAGHSMDTLPVEKRVAFMSGHVEAGLALYRAGAPDQAAPHLLHPVSETHQAERAGIDALGFDATSFEAVSKALGEGRDASEIEPMLAAAEANMALMQENAGGDTLEIITYLMETVVEEYSIGVKEGVVTDAGEYQDAYGFSVVALKMAKRLEDENAARLISELESLVKLWPETGPLADSTPTPVAQVVAQTSKVLLAMSDLR